MANHKSAIKRIRSSELKRLHNRYYHKTMRNAMRMFLKTKEKIQLDTLFPKLVSMIDKLAKKNVIHSNKAANLKSRIHIHYNTVQL